MTSAINIADLSFSWKRASPPLILIPEWQVRAGARVFLHGPSGCGKTTLLNLLCGIAKPDKGHIIVNGTDICQLSARARDRFRARCTGVIFQQFNLLSYLSVADNIRLGLAFDRSTRNSRRHIDDRIMELLDQLGLPRSCAGEQAARLSVGQQQRVAIARALINAPPVIIADEPTSALDADARDGFISALLQGSLANQSTVLFFSHDHTLASHFDQIVDLRSINTATAENSKTESDNVS